MILYQCVRWMEERNRLQNLMRETGGKGIKYNALQRRMELLEKKMLAQANEMPKRSA